MKINKLKQKLNKNKVDGAFISNPKSIQYLIGYKCTIYDMVQDINDPEVFLLITKDRNYLLADPRHLDTFNSIKGFEKILLPYPTNVSNLSLLINKLCVSSKTIGFEENSLLYKDYSQIKKCLKLKPQDISEIILSLRLIKDKTEIKLLKKAADITSAGFEYALSILRQGMTEKELAFEISNYFIRNADGNSFYPTVAFQEGSAIPHYESTDKKIVGDGILLIDLGCIYKGYCGDMTRTVYIGKPSKKFKQIYEEVLKAQTNCLKSIKTGMTGKEVDLLARNRFSSGMKPLFTHGTGHGIGLNIHEDPRIRTENLNPLKNGMVFSVEPGIYIPGWSGIRIEDVVYLKNGKAVNLTKTPKALREIKLVKK